MEPARSEVLFVAVVRWIALTAGLYVVLAVPGYWYAGVGSLLGFAILSAYYPLRLLR